MKKKCNFPESQPAHARVIDLTQSFVVCMAVFAEPLASHKIIFAPGSRTLPMHDDIAVIKKCTTYNTVRSGTQCNLS